MTDFYEYEIRYNPKFYSRLRREMEIVEDRIVNGDINLKEVTNPILIKNEPYYCFNRTDDCLFCFYSAKELAKDVVVKDYCEKRIIETLEARQHMGSRLPKSNIEEPYHSKVIGPAIILEEKVKIILSTVNDIVIEKDKSYCKDVIKVVREIYRNNKKDIPKEIALKIREIEKKLKKFYKS